LPRSTLATRCAIVNWLSPQQTGRFGNSPSLARSATRVAIKYGVDAADRQKLTPIRPKFGRLSRVPFRAGDFAAEKLLRIIFAFKANICRENRQWGAVGRCVARLYRARCRGLSHGADLASGDLIQIFPQSFARHSDRLRIFPCDRHPCFGSFIYRIWRNARRPVTAAPTANRY
jgi:hypothetical protein